MRSNTADELHAHLLAIAIGRARITELTCAAIIMAYLGFEIARNWQ